MLRNTVGVLALAVGATASWATPGRGDSIVVLDNYVIERSVERDSDEAPQTISLKDCEENADVVYSTNVTLSGSTRSLEVWVGPESCLDLAVRTEQCHRV